LHGKEVVVECKFDGDRIQIHKNGSEIHFFSSCAVSFGLFSFSKSLYRAIRPHCYYFDKVVYAFSKSGSTISSRDEGIVLKDLNSKWEPSDRSGKWLKLKPDYVHASSNLDVLIIGGYYGSGRRGGEVAQFLVGLAEGSAPNLPQTVYSKYNVFISFCRVGTGLSDDELDALVKKLKPYLRKNEYPKKTPSYYEVTNSSKERPDVWIESPEKSIILSITSDIRTIRSEKKKSAKPSSVIRVDVCAKAYTKANGEPSNEEVAKNLVKIEELKKSLPLNSTPPPLKDDMLSQVLGPERQGRV
ncbi:hypothetical protein GIB67_032240, partial [Kingdonia uniflora]